MFMPLSKLTPDLSVKQINLNTALLILLVPAMVYLDGSIRILNDRVARIEQRLTDKLSYNIEKENKP